MKIAVTGGIGSGKSLALRYIYQMGYPVFSCDEIYKSVIQSQEYIHQIALYFPEVVHNGLIVREKLAKVIFNNPKNREKVNAIAHPMIMNVLREQMSLCQSDLIFAEIPLLFEGNLEHEFDKVIYIYRDKSLRISNVMARDGLGQEEVKKRIASQFNPDSEEGKARLKACDAIVIENNTTAEELEKKIIDFINSMKH